MRAMAGKDPGRHRAAPTRSVDGRFAGRNLNAATGHLLTFASRCRRTGTDWVLPFDIDLRNHAGCRKRTVAVFSAIGRSTSELDVRRPHGATSSKCQRAFAGVNRQLGQDRD